MMKAGSVGFEPAFSASKAKRISELPYDSNVRLIMTKDQPL